ncbi:MAG TPA: hypothetical protein V6C52_07575 [Coleofasciculaceae cyanobacterium]|jgi:hypothetical protein
MYFNPLNQYNLRGMLGPYAAVIQGGQPAVQANASFYQVSSGNNPVPSAPQSSVGMMLAMFQAMMQMFFSMMSRPSGYGINENGSYNNCQCEPTPPPPPADKPVKVNGSAGLFGDPQFGVFTPNLGNIPEKLKGFESGITAGQTVTLLKDSDKGGLEVTATGVQVDPNDARRHGIGSATFKAGNSLISINGNGELKIDGVLKGNINSPGEISAIQLPGGLTVSTGQAIDGANGQQAERFIITNGEYKITAAVRKPHPESTAYLDMNFEELASTSADNATGYQASIPGITNKFGIADLLRLEPGDLSTIA